MRRTLWSGEQDGRGLGAWEDNIKINMKERGYEFVRIQVT
jgi:hypothetical protein